MSLRTRIKIYWVASSICSAAAAAIFFSTAGTFESVILTAATVGVLCILSCLFTELYFKFSFEKFKSAFRSGWREKNLNKYADEIKISELTLVLKTFAEAYDEMRKADKDIKSGEDLDKLKYELVATISHELRTPIAGLNWAMPTLVAAYKEKNDDNYPLLLECLNATGRLSTLSEELVESVDLDRKSPTNEMVILDSIVSKVVAASSLFAKSKNVAIVTKIPKQLPAIRGDERNIRFTLHNVLSNAINYSHPGSIVNITAENTDDEAVIKIIDSGIGIPKNFQPHVFEQFSRAENAKRFRADGSGNGLYLSKMIVEKYGGDISFESTEDKGSVFAISLPIHPKGELEAFIKS